MRDVNGARFYEGRDVNHAKVQAAQRRVGDQLEAERLARIRRRDALRPAHEYGPHRPDDAPVLGTVAVRVRWEWTHLQLDDLMLRQREQINRLAHERANR